MSEIHLQGFKQLFEIRLLHHYWLDDGKTNFDKIDPARQEKILLAYDRGSFINLEPVESTSSLLNSLKCLYRDTKLGGVVLVNDDVKVPADAIFEFVLTIRDNNFNNYTTQSFLSHGITELYDQAENKIYRFKENVFVFENISGTKSIDKLFLSKPYPEEDVDDLDNAPAEALYKSGDFLFQTVDELDNTIKLYDPLKAEVLPVFIHQDDIPEIKEPASLAGKPARGIELTKELPTDIYGLIRIHATHSVDDDFSCVTNGKAKAKAPVFELRFKNRTSIWQYKSKTDPTAAASDIGKLPMTYYGNASSNGNKKMKPATDSIIVTRVDNDPTKKIDKIISEIFE